MHALDLTSWQSIVSTLVGLALFTLIGVGIRLLAMMTIQQRRERLNRQINERLKTLIAAYKTLGGSFTGTLSVDPRHLRDLKRQQTVEGTVAIGASGEPIEEGSDRARRVRDAVEAALSDIILLGTKDQARLAAAAATALVAGETVHVDALVTSLRDFIRDALDIEPLTSDVAIPKQGPARPSGGGAGSKARGDAGGDRAGRGGGAGGGGMMGGGGGMGMGLGLGVAGGSAAHGAAADDQQDGS